MPINDIQLRMREIGRIRLGDKTERGAPRRLDRFRLTSADKRILEEASTLYGGTVRPWKEQPGQYELYITADELPICVDARSCASQFYELWSGGGCKRRCDGQWNEIDDTPCQCDPENRECKPTTRLPVMLFELSGIGVWRLESHGFYSAVELPGAAEILRRKAAEGQFVPATIAIEQRTVKRIEQGKPVTKKFPVPVIRLRERLVNLLRPSEPQKQIGGTQLAIAGSSPADDRKAALRALRSSRGWNIPLDDREATVARISRLLRREVTVQNFGQVSAEELASCKILLDREYEIDHSDAWDDGTKQDAPAADPPAPKPSSLGPCPACGSLDDCACTIEQRDAALRARENTPASDTLIDVERDMPVHPGAFDH